MDTTKIFLTFNLGSGPSMEPDIGTEEFLNSYLEYTCWLRVLTAQKLYHLIADPEATQFERLASVASFYQTAGLVIEDALSMYVAWSLWSLDKTKSLPDILERVVIQLGKPKKTLSPSYAPEVHKKYSETESRIHVYARQYLSQLLLSDDAHLPLQFGIKWKKHPSVKLVPAEIKPMWDSLGQFLRDILQPLVDPKGQLLATCYNKIKHGPQMLVMPLGNAIQRRGILDANANASKDETAIRLLFKGARTQETKTDLIEQLRVSPFLVSDSNNIKRVIFRQIVSTTSNLSIVGTWIFNTNFIDRKRSLQADKSEIISILEAHRSHLEESPY